MICPAPLLLNITDQLLSGGSPLLKAAGKLQADSRERNRRTAFKPSDKIQFTHQFSESNLRNISAEGNIRRTAAGLLRFHSLSPRMSSKTAFKKKCGTRKFPNKILYFPQPITIHYWNLKSNFRSFNQQQNVSKAPKKGLSCAYTENSPSLQFFISYVRITHKLYYKQ